MLRKTKKKIIVKINYFKFGKAKKKWPQDMVDIGTYLLSKFGVNPLTVSEKTMYTDDRHLHEDSSSAVQ